MLGWKNVHMIIRRKLIQSGRTRVMLMFRKYDELLLFFDDDEGEGYPVL